MKSLQWSRRGAALLGVVVMVFGCGDDRGSSPPPALDRGGAFADAGRDGGGDTAARDGNKDGNGDGKADGKANGVADGNVGSSSDGKGGSPDLAGNGQPPPGMTDAGGPQGIDPAACEACERTMCRMVPVDTDKLDYYGGCLEATGTIKEGNAQGAPKKDVCREIVTCLRRTGCVDVGNPANGGQPCYCGSASENECLRGMANGPCKTE